MTCKLHIGGRVYEGWTGVTVTRTIEDAASAFSLDATIRYPGSGNPVQILPGATCRVSLDDLDVITGYIGAIGVQTDSDGSAVTIAGRSKTGDLVDCSPTWKGGVWTRRTISQIASDLCAPFGIEVVTLAESDPIPSVRVQTGETVFDLLDRLARLRGLLLTDDAAGRLVITRGGLTSARGGLTLPGNVLESSVALDVSKRFSDYICRGQTVGDDQGSGTTVSAVSGSAKDAIVERHRPLIVTPPTAVDRAGARAFAAWEASTRAGKSISYNCKVVGWRQWESDDAPLWTPNEVVRVQDTSCGVDAKMLLTGVTFSLDEQGTFTELQLAPQAGFELVGPLSRPKFASPQKGIAIWSELEGGVQP